MTEGEASDAARRIPTRPQQRQALAKTNDSSRDSLCLAFRGNEEGLRFRKQHAADPYVLDFYCATARLAIEVDGEAHNHGNRLEQDAAQDAWLTAQNIQVLRYPAREMLAKLDDAVRQITSVALQRRTTIES